MKIFWFKRKGIFYVPASLEGWIVLLAAVVYAVFEFMHIDGRSHSASDTLINFAFYLIIIGAVYSFIGFLTGGKKDNQDPEAHKQD